jgi:hypothetical protein
MEPSLASCIASETVGRLSRSECGLELQLLLESDGYTEKDGLPKMQAASNVELLCIISLGDLKLPHPV